MSDIPTPEAPAVKPKRKKQPAQRKPQQRDPAIAAIYAEAKQKAAEHRKAQASAKAFPRVMALVAKLSPGDQRQVAQAIQNELSRQGGAQ